MSYDKGRFVRPPYFATPRAYFENLGYHFRDDEAFVAWFSGNVDAAREYAEVAAEAAEEVGRKAEEAETARESAEARALDAEAWAAGTRGGEAVPEEDPAHENNAAYYAAEMQETARRQAAMEGRLDAQDTEIAALRHQTTNPFVVAHTKEEMTDPTKGYVYVGDGTGQDAGLIPGAAYVLRSGDLVMISMATDPNLEVSGVPADAAAAGQFVGGLRDVAFPMKRTFSTSTVVQGEWIQTDTGKGLHRSDSFRFLSGRYSSPLILVLDSRDYYISCWSYNNSHVSANNATHTNTDSVFQQEGPQTVFVALREGDTHWCASFRRKDGASMSYGADPTSDESIIKASLVRLSLPVSVDRANLLNAISEDSLRAEAALLVGVDTRELAWEQGTIANSGEELDSTTRIRSEYFRSIPGSEIKLTIPEGYRIGVRIYAMGRFVECISSVTAGDYTLRERSTEYTYRLVLYKEDGSDITPDDIPVEFVLESAETRESALSVQGYEILARNGNPMELTLEQGSISYATGKEIASSTRVRTKNERTEDSVRYFYVSCPDGLKFGVREYQRNPERTFLGSKGFYVENRIIAVDTHCLYRFIIASVDDSDITPDDNRLAEFSVAPVYYSLSDKRATGNSIGPFITARSNPQYAAEMIAVAMTYYNHRNDRTNGQRDMIYGYDGVLDVSEVTRYIDCSTFVGLVLRGVLYEDTSYYTKTATTPGSLIANTDYVWAINPGDYETIPNKYEDIEAPVRTAGALAEWFTLQRREVVRDAKLANLYPGDIVFWSKRESDGDDLRPHRYRAISHCAVCASRRRVRMFDVEAAYAVGNVVQYGGALYEATSAKAAGDPWDTENWTLLYAAWDIERFPYVHEVVEVQGSTTPCATKHIVERGWDTDVVSQNNYHTLEMIGRPDLGTL